MPSIERQQNEASERFDEARRAVGSLLPETPAVSDLNRAKLALCLGVAPLPIGAINTAIVFGWPDQQYLSLLCIAATCFAAIGAMIMGSSLGGRRAPLLAARLGYLFSLGWLSLIVLAVGMFYVANAVVRTIG